MQFHSSSSSNLLRSNPRTTCLDFDRVRYGIQRGTQNRDASREGIVIWRVTGSTLIEISATKYHHPPERKITDASAPRGRLKTLYLAQLRTSKEISAASLSLSLSLSLAFSFLSLFLLPLLLFFSSLSPQISRAPSISRVTFAWLNRNVVCAILSLTLAITPRRESARVNRGTALLRFIIDKSSRTRNNVRVCTQARTYACISQI